MAEIFKKVKSKFFKTKKSKQEANELKSIPLDSTPRRPSSRLVREYEDVRPMPETQRYSHLFKPRSGPKRRPAKSVAGGEDLESDSDFEDYSFARNSSKRVSFSPHIRDDEVDVLRARAVKLEKDLLRAQRELQFCSRRSVRLQKMYRSEKENKKFLEKENRVLRKSFVKLLDDTMNNTDDSLNMPIPSGDLSKSGAPEGFTSDGYYSASHFH